MTHITTGGPVCNAFELRTGRGWIALFNNCVALWGPEEAASQILVNGDFWSDGNFQKDNY